MLDDVPKEKTVIDVCTMAIPRMTVGRCISSFLHQLQDRKDFHLIWRCHLDQYKGLEDHWEDTYQQIIELMEHFDAVQIYPMLNPQGFGNAAKRLFEEVRNDCLWIEDDWLWEKPFNLATVLEATEDCYSFVTNKTKPGAMHPTLWRKHVVDRLLERFPERLDRLNEGSITWALRSSHFKMGYGEAPPEVCRHIGLEAMKELGLTHGWNGQPLRGHRAKPRWDEAKGEWEKQG